LLKCWLTVTIMIVQLEAITFATSTPAICHHLTLHARGFNRADKAEVGVTLPSPGLDDEGVVTEQDQLDGTLLTHGHFR
jgi:hypothetical protein